MQKLKKILIFTTACFFSCTILKNSANPPLPKLNNKNDTLRNNHAESATGSSKTIWSGSYGDDKVRWHLLLDYNDLYHVSVVYKSEKNYSTIGVFEDDSIAATDNTLVFRSPFEGCGFVLAKKIEEIVVNVQGDCGRLGEYLSGTFKLEFQ